MTALPPLTDAELAEAQAFYLKACACAVDVITARCRDGAAGARAFYHEGSPGGRVLTTSALHEYLYDHCGRGPRVPFGGKDKPAAPGQTAAELRWCEALLERLPYVKRLSAVRWRFLPEG